MRDEHPLPGTDHVVDGVRLHVVQHGSGDRTPVLLLHGVPTWSYLWRDVQRDLGRSGHPTYAPDLLGMGCSERPADGRYDLASQAALLLHLLDQLGLDRVAVCGHDVGGGVAVHMAALAPERVTALVLADSPLHADTWPVLEVAALRARWLGEAQTGLLRAAPALGRAYLCLQLRRGLRGPLSEKALSEYTGPLLTADGTRGLLHLVRAFDPPAVEQAFRLVCAEPPPTLVLWAAADAWHSTAAGRRIAAEIPGASYVVIDDAGHFLPEDRPERVAEEIEGFLADLTVPAP